MGRTAILNVKILGDAKGAQKALGSTADSMKRLESGLDKASGPALAVVGGLALLAKGAITAASDLSETGNKVDTVFGSASTQVKKFAATAATSLGMSNQAALDAASTFGVFGKSAGLQGPALAGFSTDLTSLAADLASFHNTSPEEAIQALGAGLRGESEPLRKFGILLDDASLRQEAMRQGLIKNTKTALTPQQKVLASQALIMKQSAVAQGDFAKTSDGLANSQRILTAQWADAQATLGQALLPAMLAVVSALSGMVTWVNENRTAVAILVGIIGSLAAGILVLNGILKAYKAIQTAITVATTLWTIAQRILNAAMKANGIMLIITAIMLLVAGIIYLWNTNKGFRDFVLKMWATIQRVAIATWNAIRAVAVAVWNVIRAVVSGVVSAIRAYLNAYRTVALAVFNAVRVVATAAFNGIRAVVNAVLSSIRAGLSSVRAYAMAVWNGIRSSAYAVWNSIRSLVSGVASSIRGVLSGLARAAASIWASIRSGAAAAFNGLRSIASGAVNALLGPVRALQSAWNSVVSAIQTVVGWISRIHIPSGLANLVGLSSSAALAPATAPPGGPGARGFAAVPASPSRVSRVSRGASSGGIVINVSGALDPDSVARQIRRLLEGHDRRVGLTT